MRGQQGQQGRAGALWLWKAPGWGAEGLLAGARPEAALAAGWRLHRKRFSFFSSWRQRRRGRGWEGAGECPPTPARPAQAESRRKEGSCRQAAACCSWRAAARPGVHHAGRDMPQLSQPPLSASPSTSWLLDSLHRLCCRSSGAPLGEGVQELGLRFHPHICL